MHGQVPAVDSQSFASEQAMDQQVGEKHMHFIWGFLVHLNMSLVLHVLQIS